MRLLFSVVCLTTLLSACGAGQPAVQPAPSVSLSLPTTTPVIGSLFTFTATIGAADGYLYLYDIGAGGQVTQLLPNKTGGESGDFEAVKAGQVLDFPTPGAGFTLQVAPPVGASALLAFISAAPLNLPQLCTYPANARFASCGVLDTVTLLATLKAAVSPGVLTGGSRVPYTVVAP